jgi:hypothetical protein
MTAQGFFFTDWVRSLLPLNFCEQLYSIFAKEKEKNLMLIQFFWKTEGFQAIFL